MTMLMENQAAPRTHKGQGIASFIIGAGSVVTILALIAFGVMVGLGVLSVVAIRN